jgi:hypothetical protein
MYFPGDVLYTTTPDAFEVIECASFVAKAQSPYLINAILPATKPYF